VAALVALVSKNEKIPGIPARTARRRDGMPGTSFCGTDYVIFDLFNISEGMYKLVACVMADLV
jgi:hypothetical protein